jgi:hypothetical protein
VKRRSLVPGRGLSGRAIGRATAGLIATALAVLAAEALARSMDGYSLASLTLVRHERSAASAALAGGKLVDATDIAVFADRVSLAAGVKREWLALNPAASPAGPVDAELEQRYWRHKGHELESVYEWNRAYVRESVCAAGAVDTAVFRHLDDIYVFDPTPGATRPPYRFLASTHYPSGLRTNAFGWRGSEIDPAKPPTKLRVAFVGASTTVAAHHDPFSYPEYIGRWLEEWLRTKHPRLTVDIINAGREGIDSSSIAAIVEHELLPLTPDVVIYYEGANQFWPTNFVVNDRPLRFLRTMRAPAWFETHSALAGRLLQVTRRAADEGREPAKPPVWVRWPSDLDELDPPLEDSRLPVQLPAILSDLDRMRRLLADAGGVLVLSSFVWLAHEGLVLDPARDAFLFAYLNENYWPFSYAHLRRYVDFENRVFRKFAAVHDLPFVDAASQFPADPRLFVDGIHMTSAGVRLHAWITFQQLVSYFDAAITSGVLPRAVQRTPAAVPHRGRRLIRVGDIRHACAQTS